MDPATVATAGVDPGVLAVIIQSIVSAIGPMGIVLIVFLIMLFGLAPTAMVICLWYIDKQKTDEILRQYSKDMQDMREMYLANVSLVKRYEELAGDLKDVIVMSTTTMTTLVERIEKEVCK